MFVCFPHCWPCGYKHHVSEWQSLSCVQVFAIPGTVAWEAPPPMEFSRQEYWSGVPFSSPFKQHSSWQSTALENVISHWVQKNGYSVKAAAGAPQSWVGLERNTLLCSCHYVSVLPAWCITWQPDQFLFSQQLSIRGLFFFFSTPKSSFYPIR